MQLIGMLDSPYVRRVAISLQLLDIEFEHRSISVFSEYEQFQQINPVVKSPSLVCDDGQVLMDSTLILDYAQALASAGKSLMPTNLSERQQTLCVLGLALAACEKGVQIRYEHKLRPPEKIHQPWVERITAQLLVALGELEAELGRRPLACSSSSINQAGVTTAVIWHFMQMMLPEFAVAEKYPNLHHFSTQAEMLPEFMAAPHGASTYRRAG